MKNLRNQPYIMMGVCALIALAGIAAAWFYQLPKLQQQRQAIDQARTSILAVQEQETNLEVVRRQLSDVESNQKTLDSYVWLFTDEEKFFSHWDDFDRSHPVKLSNLTLADAVPTGNLLLRAGSLSLTGSPNDVLAAVHDFQATNPPIGITDILITSAQAKTIEAKISFSTVWK